jgi:hypothetical protein
MFRSIFGFAIDQLRLSFRTLSEVEGEGICFCLLHNGQHHYRKCFFLSTPPDTPCAAVSE